MTEVVIRNKPGKAGIKDENMPIIQDGRPPLGDFAPVRYDRQIAAKGPSAMAILFTAFGAFAWGLGVCYQVGEGNKKRRYFF